MAEIGYAQFSSVQFKDSKQQLRNAATVTRQIPLLAHTNKTANIPSCWQQNLTQPSKGFLSAGNSDTTCVACVSRYFASQWWHTQQPFTSINSQPHSGGRKWASNKIDLMNCYPYPLCQSAVIVRSPACTKMLGEDNDI